ncbi:MAG: B12-binding domain-containing radical SAM protein [candidate division WOR-3 bacterium]|nr:B12-binding domain-containing radical SAM protein [candidate division WOR-3 bacterium]
MKRRLLLVNPINQGFARNRVGLTANRATRFQPLGLGIIASLTPDNWEIILIDENFEPFYYREADLVGITAFTATAPRAYEIAGVYRKKKIPVVMGGFHITMCPDVALQFADCLVLGEAENIWQELIKDFENSNLKKIYKGTPADLNKLPLPMRTIFSDKYVFGSIETSRGCPMDCKFCSVSAFYGKNQRFRPVEDVLNELMNIPQKKIFFVDDNIAGYTKASRERLKDLCRGIIEKGIKKDWWCQTTITFGEDEELLDLAKKSGCKLLFIGVEATDVPGLEAINKRLNLKKGIREIEKIFRRINEYGIGVIGAFMFGMDTDTIRTIKERTDYILKSNANAIQITYLTPLPGTKLFEEIHKQGRIIYTRYPEDWEHYTFAEVTYRPLSMTAKELENERQYVVKRIYNWKGVIKRFLKTLFSTKNLITSLWAISFHLFLRQATIRSYRLGSK